MRHQTRVWVLPVLIGIALCGIALIPSPQREPEPRPEPAALPPVSDSAAHGYLYWALLTRALPAPLGPSVDPRVLFVDRALRTIRGRRAAGVLRMRVPLPAR